jgi:hypothetical protein
MSLLFIEDVGNSQRSRLRENSCLLFFGFFLLVEDFIDYSKEDFALQRIFILG